MKRGSVVTSLSAATGILLTIPVLGLTDCKTMPANERAQEPRLVFVISGAAQEARPTAPTVARVTRGTAEISGTIETPNPCYDISATLSGDGSDLRLDLTAKAREGFCVQKLGAFDYKATITQLQPGEYNVSINYDYPDTGWDTRSHSLSLDIP